MTAASAFAQIKYVAVVETEVDEQSGAAAKLNKAEVRLMTAELRSVAVKNLPRDKYNIMTSETIMSQGSAKLEECAEENCVIALGSRIGADYIVRGIVSKLGTNLTMSVEMYETEDGNLVATSGVVRSENITELMDKAAAVCTEMYKTFVSSQRPAPKATVTYTVTAVANPASGGTVSRNPNQTYYEPGAIVSVTAAPASGYAFIGWSGASNSTSATLTAPIDRDLALTAHFQYIQRTYTLMTSASPQEGGYVSRNPNQTYYAPGTIVSVTAVPASGYAFIGWSGASNSTSATLTAPIDRDLALTAHFQYIQKTYTLTTNVSPQEGGYISRNPSKKAYISGETVTLTATPESGYKFIGWTGVPAGRKNSVTVTMDGDKTVTANFYQKSVAVEPPTVGQYEGQTVGSGERVDDKAAPERKPMTGFSLGYSLSKSHDALQLGVIHSRPMTEKVLSLNAEGNILLGKAYYAAGGSVGIFGFNVPVTALMQWSFFSLEAGADADLIFGDNETLFNAGFVVGAGIGFSEKRSRRYFYRYCGGYNFRMHVVGMWWLF